MMENQHHRAFFLEPASIATIHNEAGCSMFEAKVSHGAEATAKRRSGVKSTVVNIPHTPRAAQ